MAKLVNTFSWSFSAAGDFDECRRRRYLSKYAMWGGWDSRATELQRKAYQLNKMDNRFSLQGNAVEMAVMWALREKQAGRDVTAEQAYEAKAKPFMNQSWKESKDKAWQENPKKFCSLHEHYYPTMHKANEKEWTVRVADTTKRCLQHFIENVLPRLADVQRGEEIEIATPDKGGDPEHFEFEGVKIYAIPDYVYQRDGTWHIIDWKSGKVKPEHKNQVALYGLWANQKHGVAAENITVYLEYLSEGVTAVEQLGEADLDGVKARIEESVADMSDYLVGADRQKNEPIPMDEWDLTSSQNACRFCNFYELCESELNHA